MKIQIHKERLTTVLVAGFMGVMSARAAVAAPLSISDTPLFLSTGAEPNIMLMFDTSGSMANIVIEAPYDPGTTYDPGCTSGSNRVNPLNGSNPSTVAIQTTTANISGTTTPVFRINGNNTNYILGTGTTVSGQPAKRCFDPGYNYLATLNSAKSGYSGTLYSGNYLNWYFQTKYDTSPCANTWSSGRKPCSRSRLTIAKNAGESVVKTMPSGVRAGLSSYNTNSGGKLLDEIALLSKTKRDSLVTGVQGMDSGGATPLAETLLDIGYYFSMGLDDDDNLTLYPGTKSEVQKTRKDIFGSSQDSSWTDSDLKNPIQYRCQKSFAVLLTDGRPQEDRNIPADVRDYLGECAAGKCDATATTTNIPNPTPRTDTSYKNGTQVGRSYETQGSDYLDDVAAALYDIDLRPDLTKVKTGEKNNLLTYVIGLADPVLDTDPLIQAAATKGGGKKYLAGNEAELMTAFQDALADIMPQSGTASSASVNSGSINSETRLFQAMFNSAGWFGWLFAAPIAKNGETAGVAEGTIGNRVYAKLPAADDRVIFTVNGKDASDFSAVEFKWTELDDERKLQLANYDESTAAALLAAGRVNWMRGDQTYEVGQTNGVFRKRSADPNTTEKQLEGVVPILGDIVNSAPAYVGAPAFRYPDTLEDKDQPYSKFRYKYRNRAHMVYVGANDGMLHAFESDDSKDDGAVTERFAFIPKSVYKNLYKLTDPTYTHQYYVDGSPVVGDAFVGGEWRTMLVAGLNKGGQGIYALDITDPSTFNADDVTGNFQWEFTEAEDEDLGYTFSRPSIIRMNNGKWAAGFGNGYNNTEDNDPHSDHDSSSGNAVLYILNLETGEKVAKIDTGVGTADDPTTTDNAKKRPNGLSTPVFVDIDGDSDVDLAYAGDLFGNLWKFDLSSNDPTKWKVAYDEPLFQARSSTSGTSAQPITSRPNVSRGPGGAGLMVLFGTGKYIEAIDTSLDDIPKQSFYGLIDSNTGEADEDVIGNRSTSLTEQTITSESGGLRTTSANAVESDDKGWYLDFKYTSTEREMQVTDSLIRNDHVVFTTLLPNTDACDFGGKSWLMEMNLFTGARAATTPFDLNNNGVFDDTTMVGTVPTAVSGVQTTVGITPKPAPLAGEKCDYLIFPGTSGGTETRCRDPGARGFGRQSWRQAH